LLAACAFSLPVTASDRLQALAIEAKAMLAEATQRDCAVDSRTFAD